MKTHLQTRILLKRLIDEFQPSSPDLDDEGYLVEQIGHLHRMAASYRMQSMETGLPSRVRARARDYEHMTAGLINGIKFALSYRKGLEDGSLHTNK